MSHHYVFKIISLGRHSVGKTSLIRRFADNKFEESYIPTLGVDITTTNILMKDETNVTLLCVDPGSQDYFGGLRQIYYHGVQGALLICDLTSPESFYDIPKWLNELSDAIKIEIPIIFVGNKNDLVEERKVTVKQVNTLFRNLRQTSASVITFFETSAKSGDNVKEVYHRLTKEIMNVAIS